MYKSNHYTVTFFVSNNFPSKSTCSLSLHSIVFPILISLALPPYSARWCQRGGGQVAFRPVLSLWSSGLDGACHYCISPPPHPSRLLCLCLLCIPLTWDKCLFISFLFCLHLFSYLTLEHGRVSVPSLWAPWGQTLSKCEVLYATPKKQKAPFLFLVFLWIYISYFTVLCMIHLSHFLFLLVFFWVIYLKIFLLLLT